MPSSIERGSYAKEAESENGPSKELLESFLTEKVRELNEFGGETGKAAVTRYQKLLEKIKKGDEKAYRETAREFGFEESEAGESSLSSKEMKPKAISKKEEKGIEEALDRYN